MGSVLFYMPDLSDSELIFDEKETREILTFFFPNRVSDISNAKVTNDVRRFAQTVLIAAIESTNELSFIEALNKSAANPTQTLRSLGTKLARNFVKTWWKHTRQEDLMKVQIYEFIRRNITVRLGDALEIVLATGKLSRSDYPGFFRVAV